MTEQEAQAEALRELAFVDSVWPTIKDSIDRSIFAVDTSKPGVEGALKFAADIAVGEWERSRLSSRVVEAAPSDSEQEALGKLIWDTSHADEGTISAIGANIIANAIHAEGYRKVELDVHSTAEKEAAYWAGPGCEEDDRG